MSTPVTLTATDQRDNFARGVALASAIDRPCVLNKDAMAASADATDLLTILASEADVVEMPVPPGANYLKVCLVYVGSTPTAAAVRCFGRVPILKEYSDALLPNAVDTDFDAWTLGKGNGEGLWTPRANDALGTFAQTLSAVAAMVHGDTTYCEPSVYHVAGCDRVIVPVVTAAGVCDKAMIFGWFEQ